MIVVGPLIVARNATSRMRTPASFVTGNKLGVPNRPNLYDAKPSKLIGSRTGRPIKPRRGLPSLLSEMVWEPDLPDMWQLPDLAPRVKARLVA